MEEGGALEEGGWTGGVGGGEWCGGEAGMSEEQGQAKQGRVERGVLRGNGLVERAVRMLICWFVARDERRVETGGQAVWP